MRYFFDTEFVPGPGMPTPISLGIVNEVGAELYLEFRFRLDPALQHDFVRTHVLPHLEHDVAEVAARQPLSWRRWYPGLERHEAAAKLREFVGDDPNPEFWAYFADYDWVIFTSLFGGMLEMPEGWPYLCLDLRQWYQRLRCDESLKPPKPVTAHHALADAHWNLLFHANLAAADPTADYTRPPKKESS